MYYVYRGKITSQGATLWTRKFMQHLYLHPLISNYLPGPFKFLGMGTLNFRSLTS